MNDKYNLVLASGSPRRKELLKGIGVDFTVAPGNIDEARLEDEDGESYALRMACQKAIAGRNGAGENKNRQLFLGADTVVCVDDRILGKPKDRDDAIAMLRDLSGREHVVITGIALCQGETGRTVSGQEQTVVYFRDLTDAEIEAYVDSGEPMDKAGAYGIQGKGSLLIRRIEGDYFNVVGLPLQKLYKLLLEFEVNLLQ